MSMVDNDIVAMFGVFDVFIVTQFFGVDILLKGYVLDLEGAKVFVG